MLTTSIQQIKQVQGALQSTGMLLAVEQKWHADQNSPPTFIHMMQ